MDTALAAEEGRERLGLNAFTRTRPAEPLIYACKACNRCTQDPTLQPLTQAQSTHVCKQSACQAVMGLWANTQQSATEWAMPMRKGAQHTTAPQPYCPCGNPRNALAAGNARSAHLQWPYAPCGSSSYELCGRSSCTKCWLRTSPHVSQRNVQRMLRTRKALCVHQVPFAGYLRRCLHAPPPMHGATVLLPHSSVRQCRSLSLCTTVVLPHSSVDSTAPYHSAQQCYSLTAPSTLPPPITLYNSATPAQFHTTVLLPHRSVRSIRCFLTARSCPLRGRPWRT